MQKVICVWDGEWRDKEKGEAYDRVHDIVEKNHLKSITNKGIYNNKTAIKALGGFRGSKLSSFWDGKKFLFQTLSSLVPWGI